MPTPESSDVYACEGDTTPDADETPDDRHETSDDPVEEEIDWNDNDEPDEDDD